MKGRAQSHRNPNYLEVRGSQGAAESAIFDLIVFLRKRGGGGARRPARARGASFRLVRAILGSAPGGRQESGQTLILLVLVPVLLVHPLGIRIADQPKSIAMWYHPKAGRHACVVS